MPELLATLEAYREQKRQDRKFMAMLQGADMEEEETAGPTSEDIKKRAMIKAAGGDPDRNDIVDIRGDLAEQLGFGIGQGLAYETE